MREFVTTVWGKMTLNASVCHCGEYIADTAVQKVQEET